MKTADAAKALRDNLRPSVIALSAWILASIAIHVLGYTTETLIAHSPLFCPLRSTTGIPCPGCGMTRAFLALAELDPAGAFRYNPLSLPFLLGITLAALRLKVPVSGKTRAYLHQFSLALVLAWWLSTRLIPAISAMV